MEKRNICLTITQIRRHINFGNNLQKPKQKKCKILFCYTEMAWIDLLRQLGNFNWGPGCCYNIVTSYQNEQRRFLNKEKDKKRYDVCVDRYVTVGFENSGTMEKAHRKHPRLNYGSCRERT